MDNFFIGTNGVQRTGMSKNTYLNFTLETARKLRRFTKKKRKPDVVCMSLDTLKSTEHREEPGNEPDIGAFLKVQVIILNSIEFGDIEFGSYS